MSKFIIDGCNKLKGDVNVQGAKNSTLPLLAATVICENESVINNCPNLSDVNASINILRYLGCKAHRENDSIIIDPENIARHDVHDSLMREMRSSIVFLGAIIARMGKAKLSFPGGCELGPRPIDLHLNAFRKMGVIVNEFHGYLECTVPNKLQGAEIALSFPSVGATENIMLVACKAEGITTITNAAREPEIVDLADYLNKCGAKISGAGEGVITIEGVSELWGCEHTTIPDRIAAITFMSACAVTGGNLFLNNIIPTHLKQVIPMFEESGCIIECENSSLKITAPKKLRPIKIVRTMPYPGFPTDAQALLMSVATLSSGTSVFIENIFESRYKHVSELIKMGANINIEGRVAVVEGVNELFGANIQARDLRGAAALVVAGLAANGKTELSGITYLDRGYDYLEDSLQKIGANIKRV